MGAQRIPAGVYGIVSPAHTDDPIRTVREWTGAGVRTIQLRWKDATPRDYAALARKLQAVCRRSGALFVVNDRVDVAKLLGAACHVGPEDLPLEDVRRILGAKAIVGVSTNSAAEARRAERGGASYVGFGPLYPTSNKDRLRPRRSLDDLRQVSRAVKIPVIGIGGITAATIGEVLRSGARAAAVIGALHGKHPGALARELVRAAEGS